MRFDGFPYQKTEAGYFVEVAVTVEGVTLSQIHPVLDGKNEPIEHHLMISGAALAHLWVFDGTEGLLAEVPAQPERWPVIREVWDAFMRCFETDTPPPPCERHIHMREDAEWAEAAKRYIVAMREAEAKAAALEEAKAALVALTSTRSECGTGVSVTQFWKISPRYCLLCFAAVFPLFAFPFLHPNVPEETNNHPHQNEDDNNHGQIAHLG